MDAVSVLALVRLVVVMVGFVASFAYLMSYGFVPGRDRTRVGSLLLHLGIVQTLLYGSSVVRLWLFPVIEGSHPHVGRTTAEMILMVITNGLAASLSVWILYVYLSVQRDVLSETHHPGTRSGDHGPVS